MVFPEGFLFEKSEYSLLNGRYIFLQMPSEVVYVAFPNQFHEIKYPQVMMKHDSF